MRRLQKSGGDRNMTVLDPRDGHFSKAEVGRRQEDAIITHCTEQKKTKTKKQLHLKKEKTFKITTVETGEAKPINRETSH